jgi:hypothetical protein
MLVSRIFTLDIEYVEISFLPAFIAVLCTSTYFSFPTL